MTRRMAWLTTAGAAALTLYLPTDEAASGSQGPGVSLGTASDYAQGVMASLVYGTLALLAIAAVVAVVARRD